MRRSRHGDRRVGRAVALHFVVLAHALVAPACVGRIGDRASGDAALAADGAAVDPGRVTAHRLNRVEYNNTVRTLLGTSRRPADEFPADDRSYGFDNIAEVLSLSPVQVEMYDQAARALVDEALADPTLPLLRARLEAETLASATGSGNSVLDATPPYRLQGSAGEIEGWVTVPAAGRYRVVVRAWQQRAGDENARMVVALGGRVAGRFEVANEAAAPREFAGTADVAVAGPTRVTVEFPNDYAVPGADRNLAVDWIAVEGPVDGPPRTNPARSRVLVCDPAAAGEAACAREIVARFGARAYRRPLARDEVEGLAALVDAARAHGGTFVDGVALAMRAVLVSPHFLFRLEFDPSPDSLAPHALTDHELASRLSYFVWSDMPDDALFASAAAGRLHEPAELRAQVARMLADPRARALVENFAGQWLQTRDLAVHAVSPEVFPAWDAALRDGLRAETERYFQTFLAGELGMDRFLTADFTFANARVAAHYGLPAALAPAGAEPVRVSLAGTARGGLLTHGAVLAVTSHATRTSPVKRGQWVLAQLLCTPPPPPPPGVEGLQPAGPATGSVRARTEQHRAAPACAGCHRLMDPIGFGLEHFDATGAYRAREAEGAAIDASGELPGGARFDGARELAGALADDPRFLRCVARQLFTYALGRGVEPYDAPVLEPLTAAWVADGARLRDLVAQLVLSPSFRMRRGESPAADPATPAPDGGRDP